MRTYCIAQGGGVERRYSLFVGYINLKNAFQCTVGADKYCDSTYMRYLEQSNS